MRIWNQYVLERNQLRWASQLSTTLLSYKNCKNNVEQRSQKRCFTTLLRTQHTSNALLLEMKCGFMNMTSKISNNISVWHFKNQSKPKNRHQSWSKIRLMFIVFFFYLVVILYEFAPQGQVMNRKCFLAFLRCLREAIRKWQALWAENAKIPTIMCRHILAWREGFYRRTR